MKITLNLATRPYADQGPALKRLRIGMAALVVMLALLGFGLHHFHEAALRIAAEEEAVDRSIAKIGQEERGYQAQMQQPANAKVLTQAGFLNQLFEEKSFSWTAAMEDLERVLPAGVQVTAIEPTRGKDGRLTLKLRVSGLRERSVEMIRNMEHSRRFAAPRISGENAENSSQGDVRQVVDSGKVSFDVLAEYNPATLEERKAAIAGQKKGRSGSPGKAASGVGVGIRPQYVPPNPQPAGGNGRAPRQPSAGRAPIPVMNRPPNMPPNQRSFQGAPENPDQLTGVDANGLKNHERNRIRPTRPGDTTPDPANGVPQ